MMMMMEAKSLKENGFRSSISCQNPNVSLEML